jgi:hypothetical protein
MDPPSTAANPIPNPSPLYNDFYTTTSCILNELLRTWQEKHTLVDKIRDYKLIPLTLDHQDTPIHERLGPDRLFDLIRVHVSAAEANSFTRALLVAFEECNRYNRFDESILGAHWLKLFRNTCWDDFQAECATLSIFATNISPMTLHAILEHSIVIFAKRRIGWYNKRFLEKSFLPVEYKKIGKYLFEYRHLLEHDELLFTERDERGGLRTTRVIFNSEKGEAALESKYVDALGDLASDWWVIPVE